MITKSALVDLLERQGFRPHRSLGQNFLIDHNFLKFIVKTAQLAEKDVVLEIGPGPGLLTQLLAQHARWVWAVEVDRKILEFAQSLCPELRNVRWIQDSILDEHHTKLNPTVVNLITRELVNPSTRELVNPSTRELVNSSTRELKVISNLPYATSAAIILSLLESNLPIKSMVLMVQWEMAERLTAPVGTKAYNALTILTNLLGAIKIIRKVPPGVFYPPPAVHSALITITPRPNPLLSAHYALFKSFLQSVFRYRRKTISRALKEATNWSTEEITERLNHSNISPKKRPEEITLSEWLKLFPRGKP